MKKIISLGLLIIIFSLFLQPFVTEAKTYYKSSSTGRFVSKSTYSSSAGTTYKSSVKVPKSGNTYYRSAKTGQFTTKSNYENYAKTTYKSKR